MAEWRSADDRLHTGRLGTRIARQAAHLITPTSPHAPPGWAGSRGKRRRRMILEGLPQAIVILELGGQLDATRVGVKM